MRSNLFTMLAIVLAVGLWAMVVVHLYPASDPHSYLVARWNPGFDELLRPTPGGPANPRIIISNVVADRYEHVYSDCYRFSFRTEQDLLCGVIHVTDKGEIGGSQ